MKNATAYMMLSLTNMMISATNMMITITIMMITSTSMTTRHYIYDDKPSNNDDIPLHV